jgi:hypothetical protein
MALRAPTAARGWPVVPRRSVLGLAFLGVGAAMMVIMVSTPLSVRGMSVAYTLSSWQVDDVCVSAGGGMNATLLSDYGSGSHFWAISLLFGLAGGDNTQYTSFFFYLIDTSNSNYIAIYGEPHFEWVTQGNTTFFTTSEEIGGPWTLGYDIFNPDSQSQCYWVSAQSEYPA